MMDKLRYSLDTSFLVRLLTGDPVPQFHLAAGFLEKIIEIDPNNQDAIKNRDIIQKALAAPKK